MNRDAESDCRKGATPCVMLPRRKSVNTQFRLNWTCDYRPTSGAGEPAFNKNRAACRIRSHDPKENGDKEEPISDVQLEFSVTKPRWECITR